jgi:hypothetical protein
LSIGNETPKNREQSPVKMTLKEICNRLDGKKQKRKSEPNLQLLALREQEKDGYKKRKNEKE